MSNAIISFIRRKIMRISRDRWDFQYGNGVWEGLKTEAEVKRVILAGELLEKYLVHGRVLEIGCGEGIFFQHLPVETYSFYEGIDVSGLAIQKTPKTLKSVFTTADMELYTPKNGPFRVIVLNEVLYYGQNPVKLLARYIPYLDKDGLFLVGMYSSDKSENLWPALQAHYTEEEKAVIKDGDKEWIYKMLKPI